MPPISKSTNEEYNRIKDTSETSRNTIANSASSALDASFDVATLMQRSFTVMK